MKAVFADTFNWVALTDTADPRYREAVALDDQLAGTIILTTDEVLSDQTMRREELTGAYQ